MGDWEVAAEVAPETLEPSQTVVPPAVWASLRKEQQKQNFLYLDHLHTCYIMLLSGVALNPSSAFFYIPNRWKVLSAAERLRFIQLAGRQPQHSADSAAALEVKDSVGMEEGALMGLIDMYGSVTVSDCLHLSVLLSRLLYLLSPVCQLDLITQWSSSSRSPWPLFLSTSERWAKLASPAPSLAPAPDLDPDPDPEPDRRHTNEEQYVSEGESTQLDTCPAPPDCRDAETITGTCVCTTWGLNKEISIEFGVWFGVSTGMWVTLLMWSQFDNLSQYIHNKINLRPSKKKKKKWQVEVKMSQIIINCLKISKNRFWINNNVYVDMKSFTPCRSILFIIVWFFIPNCSYLTNILMSTTLYHCWIFKL